jgi:hypothetical protein
MGTWLAYIQEFVKWVCNNDYLFVDDIIMALGENIQATCVSDP